MIYVGAALLGGIVLGAAGTYALLWWTGGIAGRILSAIEEASKYATPF